MVLIFFEDVYVLKLQEIYLNLRWEFETSIYNNVISIVHIVDSTKRETKAKICHT